MIRAATALLAALALGLALFHLAGATRGLVVERAIVGTAPVTVFAPAGGGPAPAVVIAHGFAGSQQLMQPFAISLARAGYVAVTYDARGHARNRAPLTGDVERPEGATAALLAELAEIAAFARALPQADGRLALLGHSMASDIVIRGGIADPGIDAVIAVSPFSPVVTAEAPRNLLTIAGAWEPALAAEARRMAGLAAGAPAEPFVTTGDPAAGTARRAVVAPHVEHVGVLYSPVSLAEARDWLDVVFARNGGAGAAVDARGPWIGLWFLGALTLGWAASALLPRLVAAAPPRPARRGAFALAALVPAALTPPIAALVPEGWIPAPVADYLAAHFLVYGALTFAVMRALGWSRPPRVDPRWLAAATAALLLFGAAAILLPLDRFVTSFAATPERALLVLALLPGLLAFFAADEALTRAPEAPRFAYPLTKLAFLASLALAIALDPGRLFFLVLILPVTLAFFVVFGLISRWSARATSCPRPAALANAALFAWATATTFPLLGS